jgi:hypothetical protein
VRFKTLCTSPNYLDIRFFNDSMVDKNVYRNKTFTNVLLCSLMQMMTPLILCSTRVGLGIASKTNLGAKVFAAARVRLY